MQSWVWVWAARAFQGLCDQQGLVQLVQRMLPAPYPQAIVASLAGEPGVQLWILFRPWQLAGSQLPNCATQLSGRGRCFFNKYCQGDHGVRWQLRGKGLLGCGMAMSQSQPVCDRSMPLSKRRRSWTWSYRICGTKRCKKDSNHLPALKRDILRTLKRNMAFVFLWFLVDGRPGPWPCNEIFPKWCAGVEGSFSHDFGIPKLLSNLRIGPRTGMDSFQSNYKFVGTSLAAGGCASSPRKPSCNLRGYG